MKCIFFFLSERWKFSFSLVLYFIIFLCAINSIARGSFDVWIFLLPPILLLSHVLQCSFSCSLGRFMLTLFFWRSYVIYHYWNSFFLYLIYISFPFILSNNFRKKTKIRGYILILLHLSKKIKILIYTLHSNANSDLPPIQTKINKYPIYEHSPRFNGILNCMYTLLIKKLGIWTNVKQRTKSTIKVCN